MLGGGPVQTFSPDMRFDQLSAEQMNQMARAARMVLNLEVGRGLQKIINGDRLIINRLDDPVKPALAAGVEIKLVQYATFAPGFVVGGTFHYEAIRCLDENRRAFDVAMPHAFRASTWSEAVTHRTYRGNTVRPLAFGYRIAQSGSNTERQKIVEPYLRDEWILVIKMTTTITAYDVDNPTVYDWLHLNGEKVWAKEWTG